MVVGRWFVLCWTWGSCRSRDNPVSVLTMILH